MNESENLVKPNSVGPIWKILAGLGVAVAIAALGFGLGTKNSTVEPQVSPNISPEPIAENIGPTVAEMVMECHTLTAHPSDRNRSAAGISDTQLAPGIAIPACERAVAASPDDVTLVFELGRALWIGGRDSEALAKFAEAADRGHAGAMKYIGDAYVEGRGLPPDVQANIQEAANWYRKASDAGFVDAESALSEAEQQIARNTFDPSIFQNGKFMKILYNGEFSNVQAPIALAYYAKGIVQGLDSNESLFLDQSCKAMIGKLGSQIIDISEFAGAIKQFNDAGESNEDPMETFLKVLIQKGGEPYFLDQGQRDATVLYNKDILGCDSEVTKKVVDNIMITSSNNRAF